jgi:hypothetical protein
MGNEISSKETLLRKGSEGAVRILMKRTSEKMCGTKQEILPVVKDKFVEEKWIIDMDVRHG